MERVWEPLIRDWVGMGFVSKTHLWYGMGMGFVRRRKTDPANLVIMNLYELKLECI